MQLTQSQEDYLETIYVLKSQQENVRAIDVAAALGFSKPSVSHALKDLKEKVSEILTTAMQNTASLKVPLIIDINYGKNWAEAK